MSLSSTEWDELFERLHAGDSSAIARAYEVCEPHMRAVARRRLTPRLRARYDSADVVQSVWVDLLRGFRDKAWQFDGAEQLRAFVAKAVRDWIGAVGVKTAYIERGSPWENGFIESFNARLRDELLDGEIFYSLAEARIVIESWRRH